MGPLKRSLPLLLFAATTFAVFWKFLCFGHTLFPVAVVEAQLGRPVQAPRPLFPSDDRHVRVSDSLVLLRPHLHRYNEGLKQGELRLWNPDLACGLPAYADTMLNPFYPPHLILHRLLPPDAAYELNLLLHFFGSGVAMLALLRTLGRSLPAATAGGLAWMLLGYHSIWFSTGILAALSVFGPLALRSIVLGLESRRLPGAAAAGGLFGLAILGSHPQFALLFFLVLTGWIALEAVRHPVDRPFILRFGLIFVLLSVGTGLAAVLTRLDSITNGYRDPGFDTLSLYAHPLRLFGHAAGVLLGKVWFPGPAWEFEFTTYTGLAILALSAAGAIEGRREPRSRFLTLLALSALAVAFVKPLAGLMGALPLLNLSPSARWIYVAGFAGVLLAAEGWDRLAARGPGRLPWILLGVSLAFLAACTLGIGPARLGNGAALETLVGFGLATGAAFTLTRFPRAAAGLAFAAILFELLPPFVLGNWHADPEILSRPPAALALPPPLERPWRGLGLLGTDARSTRSEEWEGDLVTGHNLLTLWGVESAGGFESILPDRSSAYARAAGAAFSPAGRTLGFSRFDSPLLDAANVARLYLPPGLEPPSRFVKAARAGRVDVYDNRRILPRARLVGAVRSAAGPEEAERLLRDPAFDPHREVVIEGPDPPSPQGARGRVAWKLRETDRLVLEVEPESDSLLLVADTDYPGWEAFIDGVATPIRKANLAFRAVSVPRGRHRVEFRFRPDSARHGLLASIGFGALGLLWVLLGRRRI